VLEELSQGEDSPSSGLRPLTWAVIALLAVLAGVVVLVRTGADEPVPGRSATSTPRVDPGQPLVIQKICPELTDGRTRVTVSFELRNLGTRDVTLVNVVPVLPGTGLRLRGPITAGGSCGLPGVETPGGLLTPGQAQLIAMPFWRPEDCSKPAPARIVMRAQQMIGTTTVPVVHDVGQVEFDRCPDAP